jgi:glutathione S-transferase
MQRLRTLKYYHAESAANSLKSMIPLLEKALPFQSIHVDLHKFEQHADWFVAINAEGQVPVLDHDGLIVTHTSVINEYLEDVFPGVPLRPRDPAGAARMRFWNKFCDEQVMNYVSMHGWHRMVGIIARKLDSGEFDRLMENIPLPDQRKKWRTARSGFSEADLAHATEKILYAVDKAEKQLAQTAWIAGDDYTLADINQALPAPRRMAGDGDGTAGRGASARGRGPNRSRATYLDGSRTLTDLTRYPRAWRHPPA